jgi:hypothetical protein
LGVSTVNDWPSRGAATLKNKYSAQSTVKSLSKERLFILGRSACILSPPYS